MFDDGGCLLCGRPIQPNSVYCSQECAVADSSSSASAPSSTQPSPRLHPGHTLGLGTDRDRDGDVPPLVYPLPKTNRNRKSISSTSTIDSDEYVYGTPEAHISHYAYSRRPTSTNNRSTVPLISSHIGLHQSSSGYGPYYRETTAHLALPEESSYDKTRAWAEMHRPSSLESPSDGEHDREGFRWSDDGAEVSRTCTQLTLTRRRSSGVPTLTKASGLHTGKSTTAHHHSTSATYKKHRHRTSLPLPSYFTRLSVMPISTAACSPAKVSKVAALASSLGESIVDSDMSSHTPTNGHRGSSSTITAPKDTTTYTDTTIRHPNVRQGASRSPQRSRASASTSVSRRRKLGEEVLPPLYISKSRTRDDEKEKERTGSSGSRSPTGNGKGRGRDTTARPITSHITAPTSPTIAANAIYASSLGERVYRHPPLTAKGKDNNASETDKKEEPERGRKPRAEAAAPPTNEDEPAVRGRSRVVVRRGASPERRPPNNV